eukprot:g1029.t1
MAHGACALYVASQKGSGECVAMLLRAGAIVDQPMDSGATALYIAAQQGHERVVRQLLEAGANPNAAKKKTCASALYAAAKAGHHGCLRQLLAAGANPNWTLPTGSTALFALAARGDTLGAKMLLEAGANPSSPLAPGTAGPAASYRFCWQLAEDAGHAECADVLRGAADAASAVGSLARSGGSGGNDHKAPATMNAAKPAIKSSQSLGSQIFDAAFGDTKAGDTAATARTPAPSSVATGSALPALDVAEVAELQRKLARAEAECSALRRRAEAVEEAEQARRKVEAQLREQLAAETEAKAQAQARVKELQCELGEGRSQRDRGQAASDAAVSELRSELASAQHAAAANKAKAKAYIDALNAKATQTEAELSRVQQMNAELESRARAAEEASTAQSNAAEEARAKAAQATQAAQAYSEEASRRVAQAQEQARQREAAAQVRCDEAAQREARAGEEALLREAAKREAQKLAAALDEAVAALAELAHVLERVLLPQASAMSQVSDRIAARLLESCTALDATFNLGTAAREMAEGGRARVGGGGDTSMELRAVLTSQMPTCSTSDKRRSLFERMTAMAAEFDASGAKLERLDAIADDLHHATVALQGGDDNGAGRDSTGNDRYAAAFSRAGAPISLGLCGVRVIIMMPQRAGNRGRARPRTRTRQRGAGRLRFRVAAQHANELRQHGYDQLATSTPNSRNARGLL